MATYRVWLTVKDSNGQTKEINAGTLNVDLDGLTEDEIAQLETALKLDTYATDVEVTETVKNDVDQAVQNSSAIKYSSFEFE